MSKKVLIFSLAYHPIIGGAEVAIKEITDRIRDYQFDLITMRFDKSHLKQERIGNVNIYRVGGNSSYINKILFVPRAALLAIKLNRGNKYDLLWAMMTNMLFPIVVARILGDRTPYVLTLQDGDPFEYVFERWRIRIFKPLLSYGLRHATKIQAISTYLAEWARKVAGREDVIVIPNGVDTKLFLKNGSIEPHNGTVLITTSRLVEKNGVGDIIDSLKYLPDSVSLKILGTGPLGNMLKSKARDLNLEGRVEFLGHIDHKELPKYLHEADIFIRPSLSEGQGISFIEAMAAGLPVIATPVGGITDFLKDGETGLFCGVNNPESIAEQVKRLIEDKKLRDRIVENGKKLAKEDYDWDLIVGEMKSRVFEQV